MLTSVSISALKVSLDRRIPLPPCESPRNSPCESLASNPLARTEIQYERSYILEPVNPSSMPASFHTEQASIRVVLAKSELEGGERQCRSKLSRLNLTRFSSTLLSVPLRHRVQYASNERAELRFSYRVTLGCRQTGKLASGAIGVFAHWSRYGLL